MDGGWRGSRHPRRRPRVTGCRERRGRPRHETAHGVARVTRAAPSRAGCRARSSRPRCGRRAVWLASPGCTHSHPSSSVSRVPCAPRPSRGETARGVAHDTLEANPRAGCRERRGRSRDVTARRGSHHSGGALAGRVSSAQRSSPAWNGARYGSPNRGFAPAGWVPLSPRPTPAWDCARLASRRRAGLR